MPTALLHGETTRAILDAFRDVHRELGFGYRELIYALALERLLVARGHRVSREVAVMVYFQGEPLARQTLDMIVDDVVIVEIKVGEKLPPDASQQLFGYLACTNLEVGLLLRFGREARFHRLLFEKRFKSRYQRAE